MMKWFAQGCASRRGRQPERSTLWFSALLMFSVAAFGMPPALAQQTVLRVGHFPNITHVQAMVARALERKGQSAFAKALGPNVKIEWYPYNAGPSAMEAFFAGSIDLTYVGPN